MFSRGKLGTAGVPEETAGLFFFLLCSFLAMSTQEKLQVALEQPAKAERGWRK